ncbi:MAG: hypothetical protein ACLFNB_00115 [Candidatus Woesearchaeota archaeon]
MAGLLLESKTANQTLWIVIGIVLSLIVLYFSLSVTSGAFDNLEKGSGCEGIGGAWAENCNEEFLMIADAFNSKDGKVCCIKQIGLSSQEEKRFDDWRSERVEETAQEGGSSEDISQGARQLTAEEFELSDEDIYMNFDDQGWEESMELSEASKSENHIKIDPGDKHTFAAVNNAKESPRCDMAIYPATKVIGEYQRASDKGPIRGFYSQSSPCDLRTGMEFTGILTKEGTYKWDVRVFDEKGVITDSTSRIISVKTGISSDHGIGVEQRITPEIRIVAENNQRVCYLSARVQNKSPETGKFFGTETPEITKAYFIKDKDVDDAGSNAIVSCPQDADKYNEPSSSKIDWKETVIDFKDEQDYLHTACIYFKQHPSNTTTGANETVSFNQRECDKLEVLDYETFNEVFYECPYTCDMYKNQRLSCNDRDSRNDRCKLALDCKWEQGLLKKNTCLDCPDEMLCGDYDNEQACKANQCIIDHGCYWESGVTKGDCVACDETPACNDYETRDACVNNPCEAANGKENACVWENNSCSLASPSEKETEESSSTKACGEMKRDECERAEGCLWDRALFGGECQDCSAKGITDCEGYPDKNACQEDYCNLECEWNSGFPSGDCELAANCESDDDCPEGKGCNLKENKCYEAGSGYCVNDDHCEDGEVCDEKNNDCIAVNDQIDDEEDSENKNCTTHDCDFSSKKTCLSEGGLNCKGTQECFWRSNMAGVDGSENCISCANIDSCSDFEYMDPCNAGACDTVNADCFWNPESGDVASGNHCDDCSEKTCSDYQLEIVCERNPCRINDGKGGCVWHDTRGCQSGVQS